MDHNDKRNHGVPLGTFGDEGEPEPLTRPEGVLQSNDQPLPGVRVDSQAKAPRQRVRTLLGVPALDLLPDPPMTTSGAFDELAQAAADGGSDEPLSVTLTDAELLEEDVRVEVDLDDPYASEVTMVSDVDVLALPDSQPPAAASPFSDSALAEFDTVRAEPIDHEPHAILEAVPTTTSTEVEALASPLPLLIPSQYVEARTRERLVESAPEEHKMPEPRDTSSSESGADSPPAGQSLTPPNFSSLAPREVARSKQPERAESSSRVGLWLVAAAMLLAAGGWFLTSGSFRRATLSEAPAIPQQPQAVAQPMAAVPETSVQSATTPPSDGMAPPTAEPTELAAVSVTASGAPTVAPPMVAPPATKEAHGLRGKPGLTASARGLRVKHAPAPKPALTGDMPEAPTRGEVMQRLESVRSSVQACAAGRSGVADLDITIAHTGTVMHVLVGGDFAGTTQGSCIARAVREARFPSFKQDHFRLLYPYAI